MHEWVDPEQRSWMQMRARVEISRAAALMQLKTKTKLNSVALVRERTIPTERPPPVGEVSANFLRVEGCHVVSATSPHGR